MRPKVGEKVVLLGVPPGFVDDLPRSDQLAITAAIGTMVLLLDYDDDGRAEVEFIEADGAIHSIFVDPKYIVDPEDHTGQPHHEGGEPRTQIERPPPDDAGGGGR